MSHSTGTAILLAVFARRGYKPSGCQIRWDSSLSRTALVLPAIQGPLQICIWIAIAGKAPSLGTTSTARQQPVGLQLIVGIFGEPSTQQEGRVVKSAQGPLIVH